MKEHDDIERARRAQELLDNPALIEALAAIEAEVIEQWAQCPARDKDGKEALWQLYKTAQKFRGCLVGYIDTGKLAAENLKRVENPTGIRRLFA